MLEGNFQEAAFAADLTKVVLGKARRGIAQLSGACADIVEHEPALWTFVDANGVEPTNNHAERLRVDENEVFTHGLEALLGHMPGTLQRNMRATHHVWKAFAGSVNQWRPSWRYDARPLPGDRGRTLLEAMDVVFKWLDANRA